VALNLVVGTFARSQSAVVATTMVCVLSVTGLVGLLSADLARFLPTGIFDFVTALGQGAPMHPETLVSWAVGTTLLVAVALVQFGRREL